MIANFEKKYIKNSGIKKTTLQFVFIL